MIRPSHRLGYGVFDGVAALALLSFGFLPGSHLHHSIASILAIRLTVMDTVFALCFVFAWRYCFILLKLYDKFAVMPSRLAATLRGVVLMMVPAVIYYQIFHPHTLTVRSVIVTFLGLFCFEINRFAFSEFLLDRFAARDPRRAIIVGSGRRAGKAWRAVRTRYRFSLRLIGFVDDRSVDHMPPDVARRHLGTIDHLHEILVKEVVDLILVAMPIQSCYPLMQRAIDIAEHAGVQVLYLEDIYNSRNEGADPNQLIFKELAPDQEHYLFFLATKRLVDVVGAVIGMILLSPLFLILALAVKLSSKGPVLTRHERFGYRTRKFTMLRLRSVSGSEEVADSDGLLSDLATASHTTAIGRLLRKTALDELPQLWNVLVGDMSLVGPRPLSRNDTSLLDPLALGRRFSVRPGMTGLWQLTGTNAVALDQSLAIDNRYVERRSLALDAKILAQTLGVIIKRSSAM